MKSMQKKTVASRGGFFPAAKSTSQHFMSTGGSLPCMESSLMFTNISFLADQESSICGLVTHSVSDTF